MVNIKTDERKNNFNIIRFFASILVIYGHMAHLMGVNVPYLMGQGAQVIAVKIFFLISGYLIAKSYLRDNDIFRYIIRRCFRIFPGLIGVVLFSVFIVGPFFTEFSSKEYFSNPGTWKYLQNIILYVNYSLPGVFKNNIYPAAVNGSLWSLPVEFFMYLLLPLVLLVQKKRKKPYSIIVIIIILVIVNTIKSKFYQSHVTVIYGTNLFDALTLAPYFFIGVLFTYEEVKKYLNLQIASFLFFLACSISVGEIKNEYIILFILPYFVFSFSLEKNAIFASAFSKNDYSYGLYLYSFVVQQSLSGMFQQFSISLNWATFISTIVSFILAFLSWHLIEKPLQNLSKKIVKWHSSPERKWNLNS